MNSVDRERLMTLKRERALLKQQLSTAVDKQILLLNQVIDLKAELARLEAHAAELAASYQRVLAQREELYRAAASNDPSELWRNAGFQQWRKDRA